MAHRNGILAAPMLRTPTMRGMRIALLPVLTRPRRDVSVLGSDQALMPVLIGDGHLDFLCWRCGFAICEGMNTVVDVSGRVFRCPDCTAFNRSRL